jgi:hypothetical protein
MKCRWDEAWIGTCGKGCDESGFCEDHKKTCCSCGSAATHSCAETGQFVCGFPLCDECEHLFFDLKTGSFEIQAPSYKYYSKISHYDYNKSERRWMRNKDLIFSIIKKLKISGIWDHVSNKDFIIVNSSNKKSNHKQLLKDLKALEEL